MNSFGEKEAWAYPGTAQIFWVLPLSQEREKLRISNLASTFRGSDSVQTKAHDKFWRKGSVGVSRDCPNFSGTLIISGTGKATDFKFSQYIQSVHPNKSPLKIFAKRKHGRIQRLPKFFGYPHYLRNGKSYGFQIWPVHSEGPSEQKPIKNFREKEAWTGCPTATGRATDFKFCMHIYIAQSEQKPIKNFGKSRPSRLNGFQLRVFVQKPWQTVSAL